MKATIAQGATLSDAQPIYGHDLVGLKMPAAWDTATVRIHVSDDGSTFYPVYDDGGNLYEATVDAARVISLDAAKLAAVPRFTHLKLESSAAQTAKREIGLVLRRL